MQHQAPWPTLVNGAFSETVNAADRGLQFGDGLFETMLLCRGQVQLLDLHLERLQTGLQRLHIALPIERVEEDLQCYQRSCQLPKSAVLKIIVTRGESSRGYRPPDAAEATRVVRMYEHRDLTGEQRERGVALRICETRVAHNTALAGIKHLNRLEQVLARAEWDDDDVFEGLMLNAEGHIAAGTMSNVFMCKHDAIVTPPIDCYGINGVVRRHIIERLAPQLGMAVLQKELSASDLSQADEVFISNSLIHIVPVQSCEHMHFGVGPMTKALQSALHESLSC
ncbi:MAG: aminodeoxychorismate lyase [Pseudomonadales bacterium]